MFMIEVVILAVICFISYIELIKLVGKNIKLMKLVGVAVCELSLEEKEELACYIDEVIQEALNDRKQSIEISYKDLCLEMFSERVEDELGMVFDMTSSKIKTVIFDKNGIELEF